jgi:CRP-like cAMP-binding protein
VATANAALGQFIRSIPLFSLVEEADLQDVLRLLRPVELAAGERLFREGDPGKAMWVLGPGVEVSISQSHGGTRPPVVVSLARAGEVVGEMALVDDGPRSGTAVVTHGGTAHELDAQEFHAMRAAFVPAAFKMLRKMCSDLCLRLRQTNERIVASGTSRVATPPQPKGPRPTVEQLERFPPFRRLPSVVQMALAQKLEVVALEELTPLFAEGEESDGAWFLVEGEVSVGRNGKTLANLPPGSMFGQVACIDHRPRSASCLTTGPALLFKIAHRDFDQLFASGHRFAFQVVDLVARQLVQHLRDANALLPAPGRPSRVGLAGPVPVLPGRSGEEDEELLLTEALEVDDAAPLEIELDLSEFQAAGEHLQ